VESKVVQILLEQIQSHSTTFFSSGWLVNSIGMMTDIIIFIFLADTRPKALSVPEPAGLMTLVP
jgi:hypothetical protein